MRIFTYIFIAHTPIYIYIEYRNMANRRKHRLTNGSERKGYVANIISHIPGSCVGLLGGAIWSAKGTQSHVMHTEHHRTYIYIHEFLYYTVSERRRHETRIAYSHPPVTIELVYILQEYTYEYMYQQRIVQVQTADDDDIASIEEKTHYEKYNCTTAKAEYVGGGRRVLGV